MPPPSLPTSATTLTLSSSIIRPGCETDTTPSFPCRRLLFHVDSKSFHNRASCGAIEPICTATQSNNALLRPTDHVSLHSFISYRQSYSHHPITKKSRIAGGFADNAAESEETRGLMSAGAFDDGDAVIEMDRLPPRWLDVQDQVAGWLENITKQIKKLDQLCQKHVLPGFDDEQVKKREEREIEAMTQEITRGFQTCQRAIRRIDNMVKESQQTGSLSRGEETMAQNLKVSLATRVGDSSALFRKKQSAYLKSMSHVCVETCTRCD